MTKNEQIASILLEAAELLKNDNSEPLNEGVISNIKDMIKRHKEEKNRNANKLKKKENKMIIITI